VLCRIDAGIALRGRPRTSITRSRDCTPTSPRLFRVLRGANTINARIRSVSVPCARSQSKKPDAGDYPVPCDRSTWKNPLPSHRQGNTLQAAAEANQTLLRWAVKVSNYTGMVAATASRPFIMLTVSDADSEGWEIDEIEQRNTHRTIPEKLVG